MQHARTVLATVALAVGAVGIGACNRDAPDGKGAASTRAESALRVAGTPYTVRDTTVIATIDVSGVAEPIQQAALSTKLMGTVLAVLVREGDVVRRGQPLLRLDARELDARGGQVSAAITDADAQQREALAHASRFRALYADSAATRAQLDAAEAGLAHADAAVRSARAAASELDAMSSYATVRAPFAGVVSARAADPGMFAAPGVPLLTVQDVSSLRIRVAVSGDAARGLARGATIPATIDGVAASATIEGVVSGNAGNLFTINAIVDNRTGRHRAGTAATLTLATGMHTSLLVPTSAIVREADLTAVIVRGSTRDERRWIRIGAVSGDRTEITSGLQAGEAIVIPARPGV